MSESTKEIYIEVIDDPNGSLSGEQTNFEQI